MPDIIKLLPETLANQIAAGEVIQRPASAVKELLENALDANATHIQLIIADAGKQLIQVIDNGKGMSPTDARMSFERHATSKISNVEDLFKIQTMGFRGEALASIAAVAQVELKTKIEDQAVGTLIKINGGEVVLQEACTTNTGTSLSIKNLFYNVPARRQFLKSNSVEIRHIVDEFTRIALAYPDIHFQFFNNGQQLFNYTNCTLKNRVVQVLGNTYDTKLIPIEESTDYLRIYGLVSKPEVAKKMRGDQYFFVNNRFIKSNYLHHAIQRAYEGLIAPQCHPVYTLFFELNPASIDVNVHPTKQEIKWEDERLVYSYLNAAIKHALSKFSISPSIDFNLDAHIQNLDAIQKPTNSQIEASTANKDLYQTFTQKNQAHLVSPTLNQNKDAWKQLYQPTSQSNTPFVPAFTTPDNPPEKTPELEIEDAPEKEKPLLQLRQQYIVTAIKSGMVVIDQQKAHQRILYEKLLQQLLAQPTTIQTNLFAKNIQLNAADSMLLKELIPDIKLLGYDIEEFGNQTFLINGVPSAVQPNTEQEHIEDLLSQFKLFSNELKLNRHQSIARALAFQQAIPVGKYLNVQEMQYLIDQLFACTLPHKALDNSQTYITIPITDIASLFNKKATSLL